MDDISLYFDGQLAMIDRILAKQKVSTAMRKFLEREKEACQDAKTLILDLMEREKTKQKES